MSTATYYFDAHNGITDGNSGWNDDSNGFDGNSATRADQTIAGGDILIGKGTNSPTSGGAISAVRARIKGAAFAASAVYLDAEITTISNGQSLGTASASASSFGSYITLSTPTDGWTWQKISDLETRVVGNQGSFFEGQGAYFFLAEIEVTYSPFNPAMGHRKLLL